MRIILRLWAILVLAFRRIISQPGLAVATIIGLVISISLIMSIPLYSDAVYYRLFRENVFNSKVEGDYGAKIYPPISYLFIYHNVSGKTNEWDELQPVDTYLSQQASTYLGLPLKYVVRAFQTDTSGLFPVGTDSYSSTNSPLTWISFTMLSDMESHIQLVEGEFPKYDPSAGDNGEVGVLIGEDLATQLGLHVGEKYVTLFRDQLKDGARTNVEIPVRIVGIWKPNNPDEAYWFLNASFFQEKLLISEEIFVKRISTALNNEIYFSGWLLVLDETSVHYNEAGSLIYRSYAVQQHADSLLPNISLIVSPVDALATYRTNASTLTLQLYAFSIPIIGLLLVFINLTGNLSIDQKRNEIAILRSRGALVVQLAGMSLTESLLIGAVSVAISIPASMGIAHLMGQARSFLDFSSPINLIVSLSQSAIQFGAIGFGIMLLSQFIPTLGAAAKTIVTYKQERARILQRPWWQRSWLDLILLAIFAYGVYMLQKQGSLFMGNSLGNPLLFLLPALGVFSVTLFFIRVMPLVMGFISWAASKFTTVGLLMAARHLSRAPGFYTAPIVLLALTLSLSIFTASLAETINQHLYDSSYYMVGSSMKYMDVGENPTSLFDIVNTQEGAADSPAKEWNFMPVSEYLKVPGVKSVTRVGRYLALANVGGGRQEGEFIGVDRADFPKVAFWRRDFSLDNLGLLMNQLALEVNGVLVPYSFMSDNAVTIGDTVRIDVTTYGQENQLTFKVVGGFTLFPTWYPDKGSLFIGNLDYLFEMAGGQFPYQVLIQTDPDVDAQKLKKNIDEVVQTTSGGWDSANTRVIDQQELPERQGLFGLLSIGFLASAVVTVMGFLLYAIFSFRRRVIEFGVLRANGLSTGQMISFLAWELGFLILMGGGVGTGLGIGISRYFIPFLQTGTDTASRIPPFFVEIPWGMIFRIYILFGGLFVAALVILVILLRRMKLFQAIKLGETV